MTIDEIKAEKAKLQAGIFDLCQAFSQSTGLVVKSLELDHYDYRPMSMHISDGLRLSSVRAKVDLGI